MKRCRITPGFLRVLTVILIFASGLLPFNLVSAQGTTAVSVSAPSQVSPGEQFAMEIVVEPGTAIAGIQFDLAFDSSLVTVDDIAEGNLLSQDGATTYFRSGTIDNVAGIIRGVAGAITTPGQVVSSPGTFATITLTAGMQGGTSPFTLSGVVVGDVDGQPVPTNVVSGQVAINQPPLLDPIGAKSANEGESLHFTISATDADGDQLVFSASNLPEEASFNPNTQTFSWTPRSGQAGTYTVRFEVSDGRLADSEDVTITVASPEEAVFSVNSLRIRPGKVGTGKQIRISVLATNSGTVAGSYEATLRIDDVIEDSISITLAAGATEQVKFTTVRYVAGVYIVDVNGLLGSFVLREADKGRPPRPGRK